MNSHDRTERKAENIFISIFAFMAMGIVLAGYFYYQKYERNFRAEMESELSSIARLKVGELVQWRRERLGDGATLFKNTTFSALVRRFLEKPGDADAQRQLKEWMGKYITAYQYARVYLVDARGTIRMSVPEAPGFFVSSVSKNVADILRSGGVGIEDFHRNTPDGPIHLAIAVPIFDDRDERRPLGVLSLRIDPKTYLYPFIGGWPTPSQTGETLLVRRDGGDALFLNDLRFHENAALNLRIPLTKTEVPAVMAALGRTGIFEGVDYRGAPVIAAVEAVPDSPWALVARINTSEVYAPVRERLREMVTVVGVLLFGAAASMGFVWRQRGVRYRERNKMAEAVLESEARYRQLSEASFEGITISVEGKVVDCNAAFARMFGYGPEEIIGTVPVNLTPPESQAIIMDHIRRGSEEVYDVVGVKKDGSSIHIEIQGRNILYRGQKARITAVRDITGRTRAERQVKEALEFNRALLDNAPMGIAVYAPSGQCVAVNRAVSAITGATVEQVLAQNFRSIASWKGSGLLASAEAALSDNAVNSVEAHLVTTFGKEVWIRAIFTPLEREDGRYLVLMVDDVSEARRAMLELVKSEEAYRTVADFTYNWETWVGPQGEYLYISPSCERITGYGRDEFLKDPDLNRKIAHPDDREKVTAHFRKMEETAVFNLEFRIIAKNGEERWISHSCQNVYGAAGNWLGRRGSNTDITARKRTEGELREKTDRLERFHSLAVGRELEMIKLKKEINGLLENLGRTKRFELPDEKG